MKTWIFTLSLELVHPLLLQALVPIQKADSDIAGPPSKKACGELIQPSTMKRKYSKNWENEFNWLVYDEDINGVFFRVCQQTSAESAAAHRRCLGHKTVPELEETTERMKAHERSSLHTQASQALLVISKQGSVVQQLQRVGMQEREQNLVAMISHVR